MSEYLAHPIDSVMHALGAEEYPCHLLVRLDGELSPYELQAKIDEQPLFSQLAALRFVQGSFGQNSFWKKEGTNPVPVLSFASAVFRAETFDPDRELPPLQQPFRFVVLHDGESGSALLLSWSHVFTDARGGEYLLRLACGEGASASMKGARVKNRYTFREGGEFARYCAERRKLRRGESSFSAIHRRYLEVPKEHLWREDDTTFFKSAWLLSALLLSSEEHVRGPVLCAMPVARGRSRTYPGNQLSVVHLLLTPEKDMKSTYERVVAEMENVVRERLPEKSEASIVRADRFGKGAVRLMTSYPARGKFADLCLSSLGESTIPDTLLGARVEQVRHFPPTFSWGGPTLVHYDVRNQSSLCFLGEQGNRLERIQELLL